MADLALEIRDVAKRYAEHVAVKNLSLAVPRGTVYGLLGPNGAGKTTTIRMVLNVIAPDEGTITILGHQNRDPAVLDRIGYLPEERGLYKKVPVLDALSYYGELKGMSRSDARHESVALLEEFGLAAWSRKQVSALSKGMQQKLQLCTALIGRPRLLILDEPFSGLDPINVAVLENVLRARRAEGTTVLLSTHQMNKVEEQCDRALMINRGHMVLYGRVGEIRQRYAENMYALHADGTPPRVAGVKSVEAENGHWRLALEKSAHPAAVLKALLDQGLAVRAFQPEVPPLEDIFVHVVEQGIGLDQGRSGPPTVDDLHDLGGAR